MPDPFDAYRKWLGIPPEEQPPNHYRLLGIPLFDDDPDVIESAAEQRMMLLRTHQNGKNAELSQRLLNEISTAKICLLVPEDKEVYDAKLKAKLGPSVAKAGAKRSDGKPSSQKPATTPDGIPPPNSSSSQDAAGPLSPTPAAGSRKRTGVLLAGGLLGVVAVVAVVYVMNLSGDVTPLASSGGKHKEKDTAAEAKDEDVPKSEADKSPADAEPAAPPPEITPATGRPVDLLELVDTGRDTVHGAWRRAGKVLASPAEPFARLEIPVTPPAEYDLKLKVKRNEGLDCLALGLVSANGQFAVLIDDAGGQTTGLDLVDGEPAEQRGTASAKNVLGGGLYQTLTIRVRQVGVEVECDGKQITSWYGPASRLSLSDAWRVRAPRSLFVGGNNASFHLGQITLIPYDDDGWSPQTLAAPTATSQAVNLAKLVVPGGDPLAGGWQVERDVLVSPVDAKARLQIPYLPPEEYQLVLIAERKTGTGGLSVGLVGQFSATLDAAGMNSVTGAQGTQGPPRSVPGKVFTNGQPIIITCTVRKTGVRVTADGRALLELKENLPAASALAVTPRFMMTSQQSVYHVHLASLTAIERPAGPAYVAAPKSALYLDDMQEVEAKVEGVLGKHGAKGVADQPCQFRGMRLAHCLVTRPQAGGAAQVAYDLKREYRDFSAQVGILEGTDPPLVPLTFKLVGDGKVLWTSQPMQQPGSAQICRVAVTGVSRLELRVNGSTNDGNAWAAWINPYLIPDPNRKPAAAVVALQARPSAEDQKAARKLVGDIFEDAYKRAKTPAQISALAQRILQSGLETQDDVVGRYVLLQLARDIAGKGGDSETALRAIDEMASQFEEDAVALKQELIMAMIKTSRSPEQRLALAKNALSAADQAAGQDQYDVADKILGIAVAAARKAKDLELVKKITIRDKEIGAIAKAHRAAKEAFAVLEKNPTDEDANQRAGEFLCFVKDDWQRGLPMLAAGTETDLKQLAARDVSQPDDVASRAKLADDWWKYAEAKRGTEQRSIRHRAIFWHEKDPAPLEGFAKLVWDKRIASVSPAAEDKVKPKDPRDPKPTGKFREDPKYAEIFASIDKMDKLARRRLTKIYRPRVFEAEKDFKFKGGRRVEDGWSATPGMDAPNKTMLYGPYLKDLPPGGPHFATFRIRTGPPSNKMRTGVVSMDIRDSVTGLILANQNVNYGSFKKQAGYRDFSLPFFCGEKHLIEFRVWYKANTAITVDRVVVSAAPIILPRAWNVAFFGWPEGAPTRTKPTDGLWKRILSSKPVGARQLSHLGFYWNTNSPTRPLAAVATTTVDLADGAYQISTLSDDGVRVYFDNKRVIGSFYPHAAWKHSVKVKALRGRHTIRVEYYDSYGAAHLVCWMQRLPNVPGG